MEVAWPPRVSSRVGGEQVEVPGEWRAPTGLRAHTPFHVPCPMHLSHLEPHLNSLSHPLLNW